MENKISWKKEFSLITNRFILKDLVKVSFWTIVFFQSLLIVIAFLMEEDVYGMIMPLYVHGAIFFGMSFLLLFSMLLLGNRYNAQFTVDNNGIGYKSGLREQNINRLVLLLLILTKPRMSGSGFLAISGEAGFFSWDEIYNIKSYEDKKVIEINNKWRNLVRLYCDEDNFYSVLELCNFHLNRINNIRAGRPISNKKNFSFYVLWILLSSVFSFLSSAWGYLDYGDGLYRIIFIVFVLTIFSGLAIGKGIGKIFSIISLIGIFYFSYQIYPMAIEATEFYPGYIKYGYEYEKIQFFATIFGVFSLFLMNLKALNKE